LRIRASERIPAACSFSPQAPRSAWSCLLGALLWWLAAHEEAGNLVAIADHYVGHDLISKASSMRVSSDRGPAAISVYGDRMAAKKVTITLPEELVEALGVAAREDGVPLSRLVASAAESELRRRVGRQLIVDWQAQHGAFAVEELAAARAEMAAADAQAFDVSGPAAA
jgi:hypothetical protein